MDQHKSNSLLVNPLAVKLAQKVSWHVSCIPVKILITRVLNISGILTERKNVAFAMVIAIYSKSLEYRFIRHRYSHFIKSHI